MQISSCLSESQQLEGAGPINSGSSEHRTPLVNTGIRLRAEGRRIRADVGVSVLVNSLAKLAFGARSRASEALLEDFQREGTEAEERKRDRETDR